MDDQHAASGAAEAGKRGSTERLLEVLADERRRHVVARLREASAPVAVADLARRVAERESEHSPAVPNYGDSWDQSDADIGGASVQTDEKDVNLSLHHCDLPKLEESGVVTYDRDRNTVEPAAEFDRAVGLLDELSDLEEG